MSRYPLDPNHLISAIRSMNEQAARLRDEGWQVKLNATEAGDRVWVTVAQTNSCDPPPKEGETS